MNGRQGKGDSMATMGLGLVPVMRGHDGGRASDRVFEQLVSAIRDLRLPPGRLLSEGELTAELGVSRTPLREAIARLADAGLVQVLPQVGTLVARIRMSDVHQARFVRETLELGAFEIAIQLPGRDVAQLRAILRRQQEAAAREDFEAFFTADEALHANIFATSGYPGAWQAVQRVKLQLDRIRRLSLPEGATVEALIVDHRQIVDALEAGELAEGKVHIRRHARRVLEVTPTLLRLHPDYFVDEPHSPPL